MSTGSTEPLAIRDTDTAADNAEALSQANAKIEAMSLIIEQREEFVATLMHDLKNPLVSCSRILGLLADGSIKLEDHPNLFGQLNQAHKSMLYLIWNTMEAYKSDMGCLMPIAEVFDLNLLIAQCLGEFTFVLDEKNIKLAADTSGAPNMVATDRRLLSRVFMNLLDNAVKFTRKDGLISVVTTQINNQAITSIRNSGSGLADFEREHIFERFGQTSEGRQYGVGTGLGLFLSKQIMKALGGEITCTDTDQIGTEFIVALHLMREEAPVNAAV